MPSESRTVRQSALVALLGLFWTAMVQASPINVLAPYQFLDNVSPNALGLVAGQRQQFGSTCVVLAGNPCSPQNLANAQGTSVTAVQGSTSMVLSFVASALSSNHWARSADPDSLPDGGWAITATNGSDTSAPAFTPTLFGASVMGFAQGTAIAQNGQSPTFSWTLPYGSTVNAVTFVVRDVADVRNGVSTMVYRKSLSPGTTSFTVAPGDAGFLLGSSLELGRQYAVELQLQDTRDNSTNGAFANVLSQSRTFVHFSLSNAAPTAPQYLPMLDLSSGNPVYHFEGVPVKAGDTVLIDPTVARGFDYQTGRGDPNFRSVTMPTGIGDNLFDLWLWDAGLWVDSGVDLVGGDEYVFASGGVDRFRVTGIETDAAIDPFAAGAFTTGVSFVADGTFNGTMTPLLAEVPEPTSLLLAAMALGLVGSSRRSKFRTRVFSSGA